MLSDLGLLWLWCGLAAIALIRPLAWETPYAAGAALEKAKKKKMKSTEIYTRVCVCVCVYVCVYTYDLILDKDYTNYLS